MASTYLSKTNVSQTLNSKFTISVWVKRAELSSSGMNAMCGSNSTGSHATQFFFDGESLRFFDNYSSTDLVTNRKFRDTNAWYHVVAAIDTSQITAADRVKIYVNGTQETSFATSNYPTQNSGMILNINGYTFYVGTAETADGNKFGYFDGSMTHFHFSDGQAYAPTVFGETDSTSGIWKPKTAPSVTYGNNGFFLKFENSGNLDLDSSGNNLTFTTSGTLTQNVDTPSNVFATLNGINAGGGNTALSNGGLTYTRTDYNHNARSTLGFTKGKWYWEQKQSDNATRIGLITSGFSNNLDTDSTDAYYGTYANGGVYLMNSASGTSWQATNNDTSRSITTYTSAIGASAGDILMGAVDADAGKLWLGVNGTWMNSGDPAAGSNNQITFTNSTPDELQVYAGFGTSSSRTVNFNFGSGFFGTTAVTSANADANGLGAFEYTVPSGYYALCTKNIKEFG